MLKEKVMIVSLHISAWSGRKHDAELSREVTITHNASDDAARVTKRLIEDVGEFKALKSNQSSARRYHYKMTLPWEDKGPRIIPVAEYFEYVKKMEEYKVKNEQLLEEFLDVYLDAVEKAKNSLGSMWNKQDYPTENELRRRFELSYSFAPIADSDDLRVKMDDDEVEQIKKNISAGLEKKMREAKKGIVARMVEVTENLHKKLKEKDGTFRDSLIHNVEALREFTPVFNFDDDTDIKEFNKKLKKLCVNPQKIRNNVQYRKDIEKKAKKLLKKFNAYIDEA